MTTSPPSQRTTLKRGAHRAKYSREDIVSILNAGVIAHVGVVTEHGPIVLPMAYGVRDNELLLHGGVANAMLRAGRSLDVCVTVTIVDGLVVARSPLHNSMHYRSVVVRGVAEAVTEQEEKPAALKVINDHLAPTWDTARPPSDVDLKQTLVLSIPLEEASAKVSTGDPSDEDEDLPGPWWAGSVPLHTHWGEPKAAADLRSGISVPDAVKNLTGANAHP